MSKYRNKKCEAPNFTELAGRRFDSQLERNRAIELVLLLRAGEISDLNFQPSYELVECIKYRPDFDYMENGRRVVEEVKGFETDRWWVIKKLWQYHGPHLLRVYKSAGGGRLKLTNEIFPKYGAES